MKTAVKNPMPTVEFDGQVYSLTSRKTVVPDFTTMGRFEALIWINRNTRGRGYQKPANPLRGWGGSLSIR